MPAMGKQTTLVDEEYDLVTDYLNTMLIETVFLYFSQGRPVLGSLKAEGFTQESLPQLSTARQPINLEFPQLLFWRHRQCSGRNTPINVRAKVQRYWALGNAGFRWCNLRACLTAKTDSGGYSAKKLVTVHNCFTRFEENFIRGSASTSKDPKVFATIASLRG